MTSAIPDTGKRYSWEELNALDIVEAPYLLDPWIAAGGITFLWAPESSGKSPLSWHMAACIGEGQSFFGLPVKQGRVLYVEVDMPFGVSVPRIKRRPPAKNVWFRHFPPLELPKIDPSWYSALQADQSELEPACVIFDTLRFLHTMEDTKSETPAIVYGTFRRLFPQAALVFLAHNRKTSTNPISQKNASDIDNESYSGSRAWVANATCSLKLVERHDPETKSTHRLLQYKSQLGPKMWPLHLRLAGPDELGGGTIFTSPSFEEMCVVRDTVEAYPELGSTALNEQIATVLQCSTTKARELRLRMLRGFPDSRRWLEKLK